MALGPGLFRRWLVASLIVSLFALTGVIGFGEPASAWHCKEAGDWDVQARDSGRLGSARGVRAKIYINDFNTNDTPQFQAIRSIYVQKDSTLNNFVEVGWHTYKSDEGTGLRANQVFLFARVNGNQVHRHYFGRGDPKMPPFGTSRLWVAKDEDGNRNWTLGYDSNNDGQVEVFDSLATNMNTGTAKTLSEVKCLQDSAYAHFRNLQSCVDINCPWTNFVNLTPDQPNGGDYNPRYDLEITSSNAAEHRVVLADGTQKFLTDTQADTPASPPPPPPPPPPSSGPWSAWERHDQSLFSGSGLDAASWQSGNLRVVARSPGNNVWLKSWDCCGAWSAWSSLSSPSGGITSDPAIAAPAPNTLYVFARGTDNALWMRQWNGTTWASWTSLGAPSGGLTSGPDAASLGAGHLDVFARGPGNALWHKWLSGGSWSAWESLGGTLTSDPSAVGWDWSQIHVFAKGGEGKLIHKGWNSSTGWSSVWDTQEGLLGSAPDATHWNYANRIHYIHVFAVGGYSNLYQNTWNNHSNAWTGWNSLGGTITADPGAVSWGYNRIDVFVRGSDNVMYHRWCDPCQ